MSAFSESTVSTSHAPPGAWETVTVKMYVSCDPPVPILRGHCGEAPPHGGQGPALRPRLRAQKLEATHMADAQQMLGDSVGGCTPVLASSALRDRAATVGKEHPEGCPLGDCGDAWWAHSKPPAGVHPWECPKEDQVAGVVSAHRDRRARRAPVPPRSVQVCFLPHLPHREMVHAYSTWPPHRSLLYPPWSMREMGWGGMQLEAPSPSPLEIRTDGRESKRLGVASVPARLQVGTEFITQSLRLCH